MHAKDLPTFANLPPVAGMPHGCAWGVWDKDGKRDQYGTLNLLTPAVIRAAKDEIQKGISVSLNWPIAPVCTPNPPAFGREKPTHHIKQIETEIAGTPFAANEDLLHFNTQSGSQWDGFKHYPHQETRKCYNGQDFTDVPSSTDNGIHHWHEKGCIVGRGVLIDYARFAEKNGVQYAVNSEHSIPASELKKAAQAQGTKLEPGDILIVRTGFNKWYNGLTDQEREKEIGQNVKFVGVSDDDETISWLWDQHFAAIAGDTAAFETCRAPLRIHEHCLSLWGMPIGELWDLERLSQVCEQEGRWTFFLTSAPLNVVGGVASPPNVLAIL